VARHLGTGGYYSPVCVAGGTQAIDYSAPLIIPTPLSVSLSVCLSLSLSLSLCVCVTVPSVCLSVRSWITWSVCPSAPSNTPSAETSFHHRQSRRSAAIARRLQCQPGLVDGSPVTPPRSPPCARVLLLSFLLAV